MVVTPYSSNMWCNFEIKTSKVKVTEREF